MRIPSESHGLRWTDIDWANNRMTFYVPKLERFDEYSRRTMPIVPQLLTVLRDCFELAQPGADLVITDFPHNLHRRIRAAIEQAKLKAWSDLFKQCRRDCATELKQTYPEYAVDRWLGHSQAVSRKHYLSIPDELYTKAAGLDDAKVRRECEQSRPDRAGQIQTNAEHRHVEKVGESA